MERYVMVAPNILRVGSEENVLLEARGSTGFVKVTITSNEKYFHVDETTFSVNIKAQYLFGEDVEGSAYVVFGHEDIAGKITNFPSSLQRVDLDPEGAKVTLLQEHITAVKNINSIVGDSLFAIATVFTSTATDIVYERSNKNYCTEQSSHQTGAGFVMLLRQKDLRVSNLNKKADLKPGKSLKLEVKGDPGAQVGFVAVDKAVYMLSNKGYLTQSKIWDMVEERDMGCTRGGGKDSMDIFNNAGLLFCSTGTKTMPRQNHLCSYETQPRDRRAVTLKEFKHQLESSYDADAVHKKCCHDGMMDFPLDYTCEKRSLYITEGSECVQAFLHCCQNILKKRQSFSTQELILSRHNDGGFKETNIYVRSKFDTSWMWVTKELKGITGADGLVTMVYIDVLKDSITQWQILAISTSSTKGVCVAQPLDIKVTVELLKHEHLCSLASVSGKYRQVVHVEYKSSRVVPFTIIPMATGRHDITVRAFNREQEIGDAVRKPLLVVPQGEEKSEVVVRILDPSSRSE
ncbi:hypothetical protein AAFF_G00438960 [Aldrovandia affinis]|uniref:Anaphylatoxin-like domain-containing protein n=1 Tax=Aldrovandia affinis TaxID=143900 RepID=A0AAD7WHP0_9TELE|nr:hypothetical protein AAFF_G00438960 [Aldrovandia affinis]